MTEVVLDASAVLAFLKREAGAEVVERHLRSGIISAVNVSEIVAKLAEQGMTENEVGTSLERLGLSIVPFDEQRAVNAGMIRPSTKPLGLSFGDRACLALARELGLPALTADRRWSGAKVGVDVRFIRAGA